MQAEYMEQNQMGSLSEAVGNLARATKWPILLKWSRTVKMTV